MRVHHSVIVVDDEALIRTYVADVLHQHGFEVAQASGAHDALALLARGYCAQALVTDLCMPHVRDGIGLVVDVREKYPAIRVFVASSVSAPAHVAPFICGYFPKPFDAAVLAERIAASLSLGMVESSAGALSAAMPGSADKPAAAM